MIDKEDVGRHIIVKKDREQTILTPVDDSNIVDEEVIFNALNYSVFENLKKNNIVFEGWRDKKLFQVASFRSKDKKLKNLQEIGLCHAKGVKDIGRVTAILELANRKCIIISDGDEVAKEAQRKYDGYGDWFRYDQLINDEKFSTAEDFLKDEYFVTSF